jgi:hypothetical protein
MTKPGSVRRTWVSRVSSCFYVPRLTCLVLVFVACLLTSLVPPQTARAQISELVSSASGPRAEVVDGVPLVPSTNEQQGECQRFADHLKRPVPCPGLLPDPIPVTPTSAAARCPGDYGALGEGSCGPAGIEINGNLFELSQSTSRCLQATSVSPMSRTTARWSLKLQSMVDRSATLCSCLEPPCNMS